MDKDESTPPIDPSLILSSDSNKPKRTKSTHACDHCKRKKVKCNGEHPCTRCQKLAIPCTFTPHQRKWDSSAPYAITQAQRLYALEKALDSLPVDFPAQALDTTHYSTLSNNDTTPTTIASPLDKFNTSSIGKPYYTDDWETRLDRLPATIHNITTLSEKEAKIPSDAPQFDNTTLRFDLISTYFGQVHPYFPIIHKESFSSNINNASPLLLNAMYAIASQWTFNMALPGSGVTTSTQQHPSSNKGNCTSHGLKYYQDATTLVELYMDAPRLSTVQALLLMIKFQELIQRHGYLSRTRFQLGLTVRMCHDLGLSRMLPSTCQVHPNLVEEKRRVFWVAYIYDLLTSIELGTPAHFSVDHCTVAFPQLLDGEKDNHEEHGTILYLHWMASVMKAQGMVLQHLRQKYHHQSRQHQHQHQHHNQHFGERLHSIIQHLKELEAGLTTLKDHGGNRFDFVFLAHHFTNILLYRSLFLDHQDKNVSTGTSNKIGLTAVDDQDGIKATLLHEANAITNIVDSLLSTRITASCLHRGFRGAQQLIHYLTAVRTVQLTYGLHDDMHVKELICQLTQMTPAGELHTMAERRPSRTGIDMGLTKNRNLRDTNRISERPLNQHRLQVQTLSPSFANAAPHQGAVKNVAPSNAIYADDDFTTTPNNILYNSTSLTFSSSGFYQHQQQLNQSWIRQQEQPNRSSLASVSKHNATLTLDTSALPLLYQPSSSSDISPMIPTPLSLHATDPATLVPTTLSSAIHPTIRARRSHQQLRKVSSTQWVSASTAVSPDLLSATCSQSTNQQPSSVVPPAPPPQRMHSITSRQSSPSTSSLPSSPLHRMTLSDESGPWTQSTPSLVLPSYAQQQMSQTPMSPSYMQLYESPLAPPEDQRHVIYDDSLLDNALPPSVDESMNGLLAPTSLTWNHL